VKAEEVLCVFDGELCPFLVVAYEFEEEDG
jgi:hypothetical protein